MAQVADKVAEICLQFMVYGLQFTDWHSFGREKGGVVERPSACNYVYGLQFRVYCLKFKIKSIMNIKPLADRVLVLPAPAEEKIGGIIIPDTAKEKPLHGTIKAVGQGTKDEAMILKEGDEVLYGKYSGTELEFEGTKYLMMRQSDVLAVIEK